MRTLLDMYALIEEGFPDERDQHGIKLILLAEEIDALPARFATPHDLEVLKLQNMFYLGSFPERLLRIPTLKKVVVSTKYRNIPAEKELKKAGVELVYLSPYNHSI